MYFAEVLSVAHRPPMERYNVPGRASLTYKIYLTNGAHPGFYRSVNLLLMIDINLRIRECLGTVGEGTIFHFKEKPSYSIARTRARTIDISRTTFPPTNCPQHRKSPPSFGLGLKWKRLLKKDKKKKKKK